LSEPRPARVLAAPDSFKGTLSAPAVAAALAAGAIAAGAEVERCPLADGGEGTAAVLREARGGSVHTARVHDPLGREIEAEFALLGDGVTAALDLAAASGLPLLTEDERDPELASSAGTGELIAAALAAGATRVLVAAGGSATVDGGRGALEALRATPLAGVEIEVLCDTTTPFERAAEVFGPQKGADPAAVARLATRLDAFATELPRDPRGRAMGGAAGGFSGGLWAACGAELRSGAEFVFAAIGLRRRVEAADLVLSGEGQIDEQSVGGKLVGELARLCRELDVPLHAIVGADRLAPAAAAAAAIASITEAGTEPAIAGAGEAVVRSAQTLGR
jgi:glycerate 2-kinase